MSSVRSRFAFAIAALLVPIAASATVVLAQSFEQMTATAQLVVRATTSEPVAKLGERGRIETWTELHVTEVLKGKAPATILVRQPGGVVGNIGQTVVGAAEFKAHEDVLLFLERAPDNSGGYVVLSMAFGKVTFEQTALGELKAFRDARGIATYDPKAGTNEVRPLNSREDLGLAEQFLSRIRNAVKSTSKGGAK